MSIIFGKKSAALIDMDGVLYDSMPGHTLAWKRMMDEIGVNCSRDEFYLYEGMTGKATIDLLMHRAFGHGVSPERAAELYAVKSRYFKQMGKAPLMPGADRMLATLRRGGLPCVLVTGSGQKSLLEALDQDYPGAFDPNLRVTALDVTKGKPDPEPYLTGARKAGLNPCDAIVIENAPLGVRAGKAAGAFTIAVTTGPIPRQEFEKEGADLIFDSMEDFAAFLEQDLRNYRNEKVSSGIPLHSAIEYCDDLKTSMTAWLEATPHDRVLLLTDDNVKPIAQAIYPDPDSIFVMEPGEGNKSLDTLSDIWKWLGEAGATRRSILVNVGGGVVSDLGGFAAATFKRGIRYANVPTSLLAAADAAIGGKTGIDFNGLKNEIGAFALPARVFLSTAPLKSLPQRELLSGLAELIKMAVISDNLLYDELIAGNPLVNSDLLGRALRHSAKEKQRIVTIDPRDNGLRRMLNFGHTAGHAFEMLAQSRGLAMSHGEAVAFGMDFAMILSEKISGLSPAIHSRYRENVTRRYYSTLPFTPEDTDALLGLMTRDKKNLTCGNITFILLQNIGHPVEVNDIPITTLRPLLDSFLKSL
ncbi:MAG: HAD-IA family hydrolase [Muribaculaceae bacterium]|nr:HAD-IA family hydrolase [Muribaculaceae bacterium]